MNLLIKLLIGCLYLVKLNTTDCPCHKESLCEPLTVKYKQELFGFSINGKKNFNNYDWDKLTAVVVFGDWSDDLLCKAHEKNVRVILGANIAVGQLTNETYKEEWVLEQLSRVKTHHADGINIDFEDPIQKYSREYYALTELTKEVADVIHDAVHGSQVTFDVAWAPDCIDGRCYDYVNLAKYVDYLIMMAYDEQSQMHDKICHARPNSNISKTIEGIIKYFGLDIISTKLVLGLPWYGYDYPCLRVIEDNICVLKEIPFRGVNCSDAAGRQYCYPDIAYDFFPLKTTPLLYDEYSKSKYFNYKKGDIVHQVWYDDPESLKPKYLSAFEHFMRGIAIWNIDCGLLYESYGATMWKALPKLK